MWLEEREKRRGDAWGTTRGLQGWALPPKCKYLCNYCTNQNDPGIDREPSSSSTSLQKGERRVGETSEVRPKTMGITPGKRTSGSQPQDNGYGGQYEPQEGGRVLIDEHGENGTTTIRPLDPELRTELSHCPPNTKTVISQQRLHGSRQKRPPQGGLGKGNERAEKQSERRRTA